MHFGFYFDISHELAILANTKAKLIWYIEVYLYQRICSKKDKFSSNCPPTFECRSPPLKGENSNKIPVCGFMVVRHTTCVRRREQVVEHLAFKSFGERYVQILHSSVAFKIFREMRWNVTFKCCIQNIPRDAFKCYIQVLHSAMSVIIKCNLCPSLWPWMSLIFGALMWYI